MTLPPAAPWALTRLQACALATLVWAAIYLPALGSLEIKGEEGRRILPAVAMLDTGRWVVPQVGGLPYLSKPPLINWLVAAAFRVTGTRSEWAARAPSALATLALALSVVAALSELLTPAGALTAAIFALTNIGLMEKGRLAEIEALYLSLYGIALSLWLGAWWREASADAKATWRAWTLPWVFLGLGLLTKGPLHLLFFYAVVAAVLVCSRRWRDLWNPAHLAGVVLMLGIFALWAVPYLRQTAASGAGGVWLAQFQGRMEVNETFRLRNWLLNIPRGLVNYLPWTVLLPLAWRRPDPAAPGAAVARGLRWGTSLCFLAVSLAPGGQPRYTLPLLVPASILLALVLLKPVKGDLRAPSGEGGLPAGARRPPAAPAWLPLVWGRVIMVCLGVAMVGAVAAGALGGPGFVLRWGLVLAVLFAAGATLRRTLRWRARADFARLALASAVGMALLTADFALGAVRPLRRGESVRPVGEKINRAVGRDGPVAVLRPGFLPFLFYVRGIRYLQTIDDLPVSAPRLLVRESDLNVVMETLRRRQVNARIALSAKDKRVKDDRFNRWVLLRLDPALEPGL